MAAELTTSEVWTEVEGRSFGVVAFVTLKGEARTAGVVYRVRDRKLYFCSDTRAWKTRHIRSNPNVSMTVMVPRQLRFMPWIETPPATISFSGIARVLRLSDAPAEISDALLKPLKPRKVLREHTCVIEMFPRGDFVTYGIGVPLRTMLRPMEAGGRVPVE